ncbi:MAG: Nucleoporin-62 C-terminal-like protein [Watsoniomyces obsoletus]|nr:MAG: Nucleoporin-62 C-terminal-like protein [Watsoniomyces obsoletus]
MQDIDGFGALRESRRRPSRILRGPTSTVLRPNGRTLLSSIVVGWNLRISEQMCVSERGWRNISISNSVKGEWLATGLESGSTFAGIDLQEGEWFDYDEKAGEEVSIKDVKWEIKRA